MVVLSDDGRRHRMSCESLPASCSLMSDFGSLFVSTAVVADSSSSSSSGQRSEGKEAVLRLISPPVSAAVAAAAVRLVTTKCLMSSLTKDPKNEKRETSCVLCNRSHGGSRTKKVTNQRHRPTLTDTVTGTDDKSLAASIPDLILCCCCGCVSVSRVS